MTKLKIVFIYYLCFFVTTQINAQELVVESNHSTIQFNVPISNGLTRITGKFTDYTIHINYNADDFTKSTLATVIQAKSIDTGIEDRDKHLRTSDFFDVEKYPEITFTSERIEKVKKGFIIHGKFTMHGVTKELSIPLKINGQDGKHTIGFSSRFKINRIDYGVAADFKHTSIDNFISNTIEVEIDFWTKRKKKKN